MKTCIIWSQGDGGSQHTLAFAVFPKVPVQISEVDRRGCILWAQSQRGLILGLGIRRKAASSVEISKRRPRLGPICIQALRSHELSSGTLEAFAICVRLTRTQRHQQATRPPSCVLQGCYLKAVAKRSAKAAIPGTPSSISSAPMRTMGSGSESPFLAKSMLEGER